MGYANHKEIWKKIVVVWPQKLKASIKTDGIEVTIFLDGTTYRDSKICLGRIKKFVIKIRGMRL
jgi:hypothetical protein